MSGIFKSVKKVFKKVGRVVKKILPVLVVAAAVYFGGAFLTAKLGGATFAQAGSVATSFTKAAGTWKSFLGGLGSGQGLASAATYAQTSYGIMQSGGALSAQVLGATNGVKALTSGGMNVAQAVQIGQNSGMAANSVFAVNGTAEAAQAAAQASYNSAIESFQTQAQATAQTATTVTDAGVRAAADVPGVTSNVQYGGQITGPGSVTSDAGASQALSGTPQVSTEIGKSSISGAPTTGATNVSDVGSGLWSPSAEEFSSMSTTDKMFWTNMQQNQAMAAQNAASNAAQLDMLKTANNRNFYMQLGSLGMQTVGQWMSGNAEEKESSRYRDFKPGGEEAAYDSLINNNRARGLLA